MNKKLSPKERVVKRFHEVGFEKALQEVDTTGQTALLLLLSLVVSPFIGIALVSILKPFVGNSALVTGWFGSLAILFIAFTVLSSREGLPDLTGADFSQANCADANLRGKNLRRTILRGGNFRYADAQGADLEGVDLRGADLTDAYLGYANLKNADLRGAILEGTRLYGTNLNGADLRDTRSLTRHQLRQAEGICDTYLLTVPEKEEIPGEMEVITDNGLPRHCRRKDGCGECRIWESCGQSGITTKSKICSRTGNRTHWLDPEMTGPTMTIVAIFFCALPAIFLIGAIVTYLSQKCSCSF